MELVTQYADEFFHCPFHRGVFLSQVVPVVTGGENRSFAISENGQPLAIVPLVVYRKWGICYGKMSPMFCSGPSFSAEFPLNKRIKVALFAREAIKAAMKTHGLEWVQFRQSVFSQPPFRALDLGHQVADLALTARSLVVEVSDLDAALGRMESQSRGAIRKASGEGTVVTAKPFTAAGDPEWISAMHYRVYASKGYAVKQGADLQYWKSMAQLEGSQLFVATNRNQDPVAYALVHLWDTFAYYSTGGVVRDAEFTTGAGNLLHWEVMRFLNHQGVRWYDLSLSGLMSRDADKRKVAEFKRSLGAEEYPYIKGLIFRNDGLRRIIANRF